MQYPYAYVSQPTPEAAFMQKGDGNAHCYICKHINGKIFLNKEENKMFSVVIIDLDEV